MLAYSYVRRQSEHNFERSFSLYAARVDENLMNAAYHFIDYMINNVDDETLRRPTQDLDYINAVRNLKLNITTLENLDRNYFNYLIYDKLSDRQIEVHSAVFTAWEYEHIHQAVMDILSDDAKYSRLAQNTWQVFNCDDGLYLARYFSYLHYRLGILVKADKAFAMVDFKSNRDNYPVIIDSTGTVYSLDGSLHQGFADHGLKNNVFGDESAFEYPMKNGNFLVGFIVRNRGAFLNIITLQTILTVISLLMIFFGIWMLQNTKKTIIEPIQDLSGHLARYQMQGHMLDRQDITELAEASEAFRDLMEQVEGLRIQVYEKELLRRNTEYQYLEGQIRPHFYLNCLNIIYNMVGAGRIDEIQQFSMMVSKYLRDLFRDGLKKYPLSDELNLIQDYLEIQKIRYDTEFCCEVITGDTGIENEVSIPPLVLLTFVENSVKHNLDPEQELDITIHIGKQKNGSDESYVFTVSDNGKGFPESVLEYLNSKNVLERPKSGRGVGIWNCMQRLDIVYKGSCRLEFSNNADGGAEVMIFIPDEGE